MKKEEFLQKLTTELKITKGSKYTIKNYCFFNEKLLNFCKKEPEQIEEQDVKNFLAEHLSDKATSSTILALASIRYAYSKILRKDPTSNISRPKKEKKIPSVLTKDEVLRLIEAANTKKSKLMISLLYATGMRVSELTNLKTEDLQFDEQIGYIRKAKGKKDRIFRIPNYLIEDLKKALEKSAEKSNEYVFPGTKGKMTNRNIQRIVKITLKRANIQKKVTPHTLRHSYATHLLESGVDIRKIQVLLGHENLSTTEIYTHVSNEQIKKIESPLDTLMQEEKEEKTEEKEEESKEQEDKEEVK